MTPLADHGRLTSTPLLDRAVATGRVAALLSAAADGTGGALLIHGEPGIGKTSLVRQATASARERGIRVLSARGGELEQSYPYGVARQLFEGLLATADPARRDALLTGAAGLAAGVLEPHSGDWGRGDGTVVAAQAAEHGLFWLAAGLAAEGPLLLAIDDAHWADAQSLRWLAYLARRLDGLPIGVLIGARPAALTDDGAVLATVVREGLSEAIEPAPLGDEAVALLVREALGDEAQAAFCTACREATGGNPLLLGELLRMAADEGLSGAADSLERLEQLAAGAIGPSVLGRFGGLPEPAARLAQAAAVLGKEAELRHAAALANLPVTEAASVTDDLVRAGIFEAGRTLSFAHPIIRGAVYADLPTGRRAALHAEAARLLDAEGQEPELVAVHLMETDRIGDEWTVDRLEVAARHASGHAAPDAAATFLRRALEEPPAAERRASVLHGLGVAEAMAMDPRAVDHLLRARDLETDPALRAQIALVLAGVLVVGDQVSRAALLLDEAGREVGDRDPEVILQFESFLAGASVTDLEALKLPVVQRGMERLAAMPPPPGDTPAQRAMLVWLGFRWQEQGHPVDEVVELVDRAIGDGQLLDAHTADSGIYAIAVNTLTACDEVERSHDLWTKGLAEAQNRGSAIGFAIASCFRAWPSHRMGHLREAEADLTAAIAAAKEGGVLIVIGYASAFLAGVLVDRGDLDGAQAAIEGADPGFPSRKQNDAAYLLHSRGRIARARGDNRAAADDFLACGALQGEFDNQNPTWLAWRTDAALCLAALGETDEARRLAADELTRARVFGAPRAIGVALRGCALLETGEDRIRMLRESLAVLAPTSSRLEHVRTLVALGSALRAAARRDEARPVLRESLDLATRMDAGSLAEIARAELVADGARPRRDALRGRDALTASELRTARMAADGLTNREIAQALFVTTKTVEAHLSSCYSKLDVSGRGALSGALGQVGAAARAGSGLRVLG